MSLENNQIYQEVLREVSKFHEATEGFTIYTGTSRGDQTYPRQLNTIIGLLIKVHQRLTEQNTEIRRLHSKLDNITDVSANIDVLGSQLASLNLGDKEEIKQKKEKPKWNFW